jgi:hypothetical protein
LEDAATQKKTSSNSPVTQFRFYTQMTRIIAWRGTIGHFRWYAVAPITFCVYLVALHHLVPHISKEGRQAIIGGNYMSNVSGNKKTAAQAKDRFDKVSAAGAEETRRTEESALTAFNGTRECYLKMLDMAHDNTVAGFGLARELVSVQTPLELVEIWNARAREAYDTFSRNRSQR